MLKKSLYFLAAFVILPFMTDMMAPMDDGGGGNRTTVLAATRDHHPPVAEDQRVRTAEDEAKVIALRARDRDDDPLRYEIVSLPAHGALSGAARIVTYTPNRGYIGPDSFTFKVHDGKLSSNVAAVWIAVVARNHAPVARNQNVKTVENESKEVTLHAKDRDGDRLTYEIVSPPGHGTLSRTPPVVTYTPNPGYHGPDRFTFKANDGKVDSDVATILVRILAGNHAPVAQGQSVTTDEGKLKTIILSATDADGETLTYQVVSPPAHGILSGTPPSVTYAPNAGFSGADSFTFKASDAKVDSNVATVSITVLAANHAPVAQNQSVSTDESTVKAISLSATDADGDLVTYQVVTPPASGTLSGSPPSVTYTANAGYRGPDNFTFKANDGKVDSNTAMVSITVLAVNHAPVAQNQSLSMDEGTAKAVTLSATDPDGDTLTYLVVSQPAHGTLAGTPPGVTYTPSSGYRGSDTFTFKANDAKMDSNAATVSITVLAVNHAPVAQNQNVSTNEGTVKGITLLATDGDGDPLTYQIMAAPVHGTMSGTPPNVTYTPNVSYRGSDSFTFSAYDGQAYSGIATVSITVTPVDNGLSITFPQDGDTMQRADIRVEGKVVNGGGETGVVVNGMLANIYGDSFVVNHVPLVEGANTITATATDAQGNVQTAEITVSSVKPDHYINITANVASGIAPLEAVLTVNSDLDLANVFLTCDGPGQAELVPNSQNEYQVGITVEGTYRFTARVHDSMGVAYEDTLVLTVLTREAMNTLLTNKWDGMKTKLANGDIDGSLTLFSDRKKERYRNILSALVPVLPSVLQEMSDIQLIEIYGDTAIYDIRTVRNGVEYSFQLLFTRDPDGIWKITSF